MFESRALQALRARALRPESRRLLTRTGVLVGARVCGSLLTLIYTVLLARVTTPAEMGLAMAALSATFLASVIASLNVESGSIQFLVRYLADGQPEKAAGFVVFSRRTVALTSAVALPACLAAWALGPEAASAALPAYAIALATAPIVAITRVYSRHAGALDAVLLGALPRMLVRPALFTLVLGAIWTLGATISAAWVMLLYLAAAVVVIAVQSVLLRARFGFARSPGRDMGAWRLWLRTGVMLAPMLVMNEYMTYLVLGSAALGMPAAAVAGLGIALSLQNIINFSLTAVDMAFGPRLARALVHGHERRRCDLLLAIAALKSAAVLGGGGVVFALKDPILGLFGPAYLGAGDAFAILLLMPLAAALCGPAALVLNVLGRRRELLAGSLVGVVGIAVATPLGGWLAGFDGAAIGATAAVVAHQATLTLLCRRSTGNDPSAFAAAAAALRGLRPASSRG